MPTSTNITYDAEGNVLSSETQTVEASSSPRLIASMRAGGCGLVERRINRALAKGDFDAASKLSLTRKG